MGILKTITKIGCAAVTIIAIISLAVIAVPLIYQSESDQGHYIHLQEFPIVLIIVEAPEPVPTVVATPAPIPVSTPVRKLTSTKVDPLVFPTPEPISESEPTIEPTAIQSGLRLDVYICAPLWDDSKIFLTRALPGGGGTNVSPFIECALIYVGDELVATILPVISYQNPAKPKRIIECPLVINLPDGMSSTEGVTMEVSISGSAHLADGIYPNPIAVLTPPERYIEKFSTYPVYNP